MSTQRHSTAFENTLITDFAVSKPDFILVGDNTDLIEPNEGEWARMSLTILDIYNPCVGGQKSRTEGIFNVQLFTPIGKGSGSIGVVADDIVALLRATNLTDIEVLGFDVSTGQREQGWHSKLLRVRYRAHD